jgi:uncharacterized delta-60 repeat protein
MPKNILYNLLFHQFQREVAMKKIYMLLAAAFFMLITGCGGNDGDSALSSAKAITAFNITSPVAANGVITEATHTIAITVPYNTSVANLVATFTTTGASVKIGSDVQTSGSTPNNFTNPVDYTVTAADASIQVYTVTVTVSPRSGSLDTTFGTSGMVTTTIGSGNSRALALGIQSNGKIVAAGRSYNSAGSKNDFALVRYNANGTLDTTFGTSHTGIVTTSIGTVNDEAFALVIQPDDSIVVAGSSYNGSSNKYDFALVRYNADGSLDTTFNAGGTKPGTVTTSIGSVNDYANALRIQPSDNKIVLAGYSFNSSSNKYDFALVRYDANGIPDPDFGAGGIVTTSVGSINDYADDLGIQENGMIVVAGYSNNGSNYDFALVRYNTDGSLDTDFGTGGIVTTPVGSGWDYAHALDIQDNGKIVVAGSSANGDKYDFALVRYNTDGSLDTDFGTGGIVTTPVGSGFDSAYALRIQSDGKIVAAGYSNNGSNYDFALARYNTDGSLDTTFGTFSTGIVTTPIGNNDDYAFALDIQSDGSIVAAGYSVNGSNVDFALVRYLPL